MRREYLLHGLLRCFHHLAQLVEGGGREHRADEEAVGNENAVDLAQCA